MLRQIKKIINRYSVKSQVIAIISFGIFSVLTLGSAAFNAESEIESLTQKSVDFSKLASQLQTLNLGSLQLRRHEKDYFNRMQKKYINRYYVQVEESFNDIKVLINSSLTKDKLKLLRIEMGLNDHRIQFKKTLAIRQSLGINHNMGLEKNLRDAVHSIENLLIALEHQAINTHQLNAINVEMLMLRRHEKDFMLRGLQSYLHQFEQRTESFILAVKSSDLSPSHKNILISNLAIYKQQFSNWSQTKLSFNAEKKQLSVIYANFSPLITSLITKYDTSSKSADAKRIASQERSKTFLFISIGVIASLLISIAILILLFRQHEKFKNIVRQKVTLVRQAIDLEKMNLENSRLANHDTLTSLPNRRSFFAELEALTKENEKNNKPDQRIVVGLLDLDGFKRINDVFGHPAGDDLLIKSSQRLNNVVGDNITLARLGGDEFGLIITQPDDIKNVLQLGQDICDAMRQVFHLKEGSIQIGATIGFVEHPSMAPTSQLLFERADYALCYSKQHSKGEPVIFSNEHETIIRDVSNIEHQLRESNLEDELSVMFQPIVDTQNNKTMGFEALARWDNPKLGKVRPQIFINAAEQMGIIGKLTTILLKKALDAASQWPDDLYMSFNLSIFDLSSPQTVLGLISIVEKSDFPSHRIVFEITETAVMNDFKQANEALNLLKLQGAQIALDDFGTGYSSLSYVQRMPLDRLKIDRSFIIDIATDPHTKNIVQTVIDLCNNLNLYCIVEGVETEEQLKVLNEMGCRYIQGYYFSRPLSPKNALTYLSQDEFKIKSAY